VSTYVSRKERKGRNGNLCGLSGLRVSLECVVLVGLPGAGKTTFYQQRFAATHRHVSKDLWPNAAGRDARQPRAIADALAEGASIVVDNTNPTRAERAAIIASARAHGARVVGYFFDVTTREAVARNAGRTGRAKVPNVAVFTAAKRLEPPALDEGFDHLFRLQLAPDRTFTITEITT
jgi:predicted kinase